MPVALLFFWPNYAKIMLVYSNYATFFNCALQKPWQISPKYIFFNQKPFILVSYNIYPFSCLFIDHASNFF